MCCKAVSIFFFRKVPPPLSRVRVLFSIVSLLVWGIVLFRLEIYIFVLGAVGFLIFHYLYTKWTFANQKIW